MIVCPLSCEQLEEPQIASKALQRLSGGSHGTIDNLNCASEGLRGPWRPKEPRGPQKVSKGFREPRRASGRGPQIAQKVARKRMDV